MVAAADLSGLKTKNLRMRNKAAHLLKGIAIAVALCGCSDRHADFGNFTPVPAEGWAYGDTIAIDAIHLDSVMAPRSLKLGVSHSSDYPYRNVVLEVTYPDGNRMRRDTIDMELADIYGAWLGSGIGPSYQQSVTVNPKAMIADSARITVRHVMRLDTLRGIEHIGIIIDKP